MGSVARIAVVCIIVYRYHRKASDEEADGIQLRYL